jgi:hypothetical protein
MSKKLASAALAATTLVWAVGIAALPVSAQTTSTVQAQIQALLAEISQLQAQLGTSSSSTTTSTSSYTFTKDLTLGSRGADVSALQQLLINGKYLTAVSAPTGYFGALTQKALAAYQAANGIKPAAGYFGPITMAFVNSHNVGTSTVTTTTTGTTTTGTTTTGVQTTTGVAAPASGLLVGLASNNPPAGTLISSLNGGAGAARVPVLTVNFTAGTASGVTVSGVVFHKVGVLSDSSVSGAYLVQNGQVLYQYNSLNNGVLTFSGMNLNVPAGQTVSLTLAIDVSGGLSAGNTTSFAVNSASDIAAMAGTSAVTPTGTFPLQGNVFTVTNVSNPSLASLAINHTSIGTTVTAGTQNNLVGAWNFSVQNSKVYLEGIAFHVVGSAQMSNIQNVKLEVNGTQVGATLPSISANGIAYFSATSTPGVLNTGNNNVQIYADVMGSPSYNFQFEIQNGFDILALDSQYNVPVTSNSDDGTQVTIQQGTITTTQDANTPTGNIALGQSQVTLAKFDIYAAGEPVKVQYLPFSLSFTGLNTASDTALSQVVQNIAITDDAGGQVGTTINQPPSQYVSSGFSYPANTGVVSYTYNDSFGSSASPINYIVPANTTRVLSLKADIESTANFGTILASLVQPAGNNLQGMISNQNAQSSGATGSALTLVQSLLTAGQNNALGAQTIAAGATSQEIGSYALTASSADGVNVSNLSVGVGSLGTTNGTNSAFQNLKVMVNGTQFGTTQATVAPSAQYSFSGTPFLIPEGGTVDVNVYADTLSTATGTTSSATTLESVAGTGQTSFTSVSLPAAVPGQGLSFGSGDSLIVSTNASQPAASYVTMGTTGNQLAEFNLQESGNLQPLHITSLTVQDQVTGGSSSSQPEYSNLQLTNNGAVVATAAAPTASQTQTTIPQVNASSTVSFTEATTGSAYNLNYYVTINGHQAPAQQVSIGTSTSSDATAIAAAVAATINGNYSFFGLTSGSATASGGTVTVTSNQVNNLGLGVTFFGNTTGVVATPTNNAGTPSKITYSNTAGTYSYTFTFPNSNPLTVPQNNQIALMLVGNAASYGSQPGNDGSINTFSIPSASNVVVLGASTNAPVAVSGSATGNPMTTVQSSLGFSTTQSPSISTAQGLLGTMNLTASSAGAVTLGSVSVTITNANATSSSMAAFLATSSFYLAINNTNVTASSTGATETITTGAASTTATVTWTFPTSTAQQLTVNANSPLTLQLYGNLGNFPAQTSITQTITGAVSNTGVTYYDHTGNLTGAPAITLPVSTPNYQLFSFGR